MALRDSLLPELKREMAVTRKTLERVPADRLDYQPHPKSFTLGALAQHLATVPMWGAMTLNTADLDISGPRPQEHDATVAAILARFDKNLADFTAALTGASDEALLAPWSLKSGSQVHFTMPRLAVLRGMVMNHAVHHRAQLGVYLRLLDVPVPSMYGPSADEAGGF